MDKAMESFLFHPFVKCEVVDNDVQSVEKKRESTRWKYAMIYNSISLCLKNEQMSKIEYKARKSVVNPRLEQQ